MLGLKTQSLFLGRKAFYSKTKSIALEGSSMEGNLSFLCVFVWVCCVVCVRVYEWEGMCTYVWACVWRPGDNLRYISLLLSRLLWERVSRNLELPDSSRMVRLWAWGAYWHFPAWTSFLALNLSFLEDGFGYVPCAKKGTRPACLERPSYVLALGRIVRVFYKDGSLCPTYVCYRKVPSKIPREPTP